MNSGTAETGVGDKAFVPGYHRLAVGHIFDETKAAAAQKVISFCDICIRGSHPLPDVAGHIVDTKRALVKIKTAGGICFRPGELVNLAARSSPTSRAVMSSLPLIPLLSPTVIAVGTVVQLV